MTTPKSVAFDLALRHGVRAGRRNFEFIDNKPDCGHAEEQFTRMIAHATAKPLLICIMHDRSPSVAALEKLLPAIRAADIELTYVAELLEHPSSTGGAANNLAHRPRR